MTVGNWNLFVSVFKNILFVVELTTKWGEKFFKIVASFLP